MKKFLILHIAAVFGALALSSCAQDDKMNNIDISANIGDIRTVLDGYKAATCVDVSSLEQAIADISESVDSGFSVQYAKEYLLGVLGSVADMLEGEHSYAGTWADTDSLLSATVNLWNLFSTENGILSLLQNNSYNASFSAGPDTCYTVKMTSLRGNEFESGSLETGLVRDIVVQLNDCQLIRIVLQNTLDIKYSFQQPSLTPGATKGISIEYGDLLIEANESFVSTSSGNFVVNVSRDGQEISNMVCDLTRNGKVVAANANIGLMEEANIGVQVNDMLQFAMDNVKYAQYQQLQGVSFDECSGLASSWNSNAMITVDMSGSPFLDMHMGCLAVEDTVGLYVPDAVFTLSEYPDEELTYDELTDSLGTDLIQLIMDMFTGGGGEEGGDTPDYPDIIL